MLLYQKNQAQNMIDRWGTHVEQWLIYKEQLPECNLHVLSNEELADKFENTVLKIGKCLNITAPIETRRPD